MEHLRSEDRMMPPETVLSTVGGEQIAVSSEECTLSDPHKKFQARITTAHDLPDHLLESILNRLPLLKHHLHRYSLGSGWASLMSPSLRRTSPLPRPWFFRGIQKWPPRSQLALDGQTSTVTTKWHDISLHFSEPEMGKEEEIHVCLEGTSPINSSFIDHEIRANSDGNIRLDLVAGKGLLFLSTWPRIFSNTSVRPLMYVFNPINGSKRILPSVPAYKHVTSKRCIQTWIPLKLVVDLKQKVGLKSGDLESSSYKCYVLERGLQINMDVSDLGITMSCRIIVHVYDSILNTWAPGIVWERHETVRDVPLNHLDRLSTLIGNIYSTGTHQKILPHVLPMEDGSLCIFDGSSISKMSLSMYRDCALVGTVRAPCVIQAEDGNCGCSRLQYCGCISNAIFQSEGKVLFFKQTSWQGPFGPNCISVTLWELDATAMAWQEPVTLPTHRFEVCHPPHNDEEIRRLNPDALPIVFRYEGMLVVVLSHLRLIAALDISKKTWCKVPPALLETAEWYSKANIEGGSCNDVDRLLFQPSCHARA